MSKTLHLATPDMTRDGAAEVLQKHKIHHAVVQNIEGKFAGVFSSWDTRESAPSTRRCDRRPVPSRATRARVWLTCSLLFRVVFRDVRRCLRRSRITVARSTVNDTSCDDAMNERTAQAWPYNRTAWLQFDQTMSPRKRDAEEEKKAT